MIRLKIRWWTLFLLLLIFNPSGKAECQKPKPVGNVILTDESNLKNDFPSGSDVTLECANGYEVHQGSDRITCTGETWSAQELICKEKDCGVPSPLPNMQYDIPNGTLFGAFIRPYCDRGYNLQGSTYRQCLTTGWTGRSRCLLRKCKKPPEIHNGIITNYPDKEFPEFQDVIQYSCYQNYTLEGNSSIVCEENGEYSSPPPRCRDKREPTSEPTDSTPSNLHTNSTLSRLGDLREPEPTQSTPSNLSTNTTPPGSRGMVDEASFGQFLSKAEVIGIVSGLVILVLCILFAFYRRLKRKGVHNRTAPACSSARASSRRHNVSGNADV